MGSTYPGMCEYVATCILFSLTSFFQIRAKDEESAVMSLTLMKVRYSLEPPLLRSYRVIAESRIGAGRQRRYSTDSFLRPRGRCCQDRVHPLSICNRYEKSHLNC